MTQEHKELLLKDLCARLFYNVKIAVNDKVEILQGVNVLDNVAEYGSFLSCDIDDIKPYLFPMSSMTEEQKFEFDVLQVKTLKSSYATPMECTTILQWCYKNHIDIYGLIPMGLAIDATNKNIY